MTWATINIMIARATQARNSGQKNRTHRGYGTLARASVAMIGTIFSRIALAHGQALNTQAATAVL